jgi:Zn-dependent peptidase ImmA (M78 family)
MPARVPYCERLAAKLQKDMALTVPIDVEVAAARLSLHLVRKRRMREDALLALLEKTIYVNASAPKNRARFSIAHEIGHYALDHERERLDRCGEETLSGSPVWETEANYFASAFLMPKSDVTADYRPGLDIAALSNKYVVSEQAMTVRLQNLKLL